MNEEPPPQTEAILALCIAGMAGRADALRAEQLLLLQIGFKKYFPQLYLSVFSSNYMLTGLIFPTIQMFYFFT